MKYRIPVIIAAIISLSAGAILSMNAGEKSPSIIMKASNGDVFNPAKAGKSKLLVLSFFSSDCVPCLKEIPELQKIQDESGDVAIYLVADTGTDGKKAEDFLKLAGKQSGIKINLPIVYDIYSDMKQSFGVKSFPALFLVDRSGVIAIRFDGYIPENIAKLKQRIKELK